MTQNIISDQAQLKLLADLTAINTVNAHEESLVTYLATFLKLHHVKTEIIKGSNGRANLVAEVGTEGPLLGFAGHADTVHEGNRKDWEHYPFTLTDRSGHLYGRGVTDMKAALASFAVAMVNLQASELTGRVRFMVTLNEEKAQAGAKQLCELGYVDDMEALIIGEPTGVRASEITNYLHSGGVRLNNTDPDELINTVKNNYQIEQHFAVYAHKGFLVYDVIAHGKAAHSSTPALGVDAIARLVDYYQAETELYQQLTNSNPMLGRTVRGANMFHGGVQPNSIAGEAQLSELTRIIPELPPKELENALTDLIDTLNRQAPEQAQLELVVHNMGEAMLGNPDSEIVTLGQKHAKLTFPTENTLPTLAVSMGTDATRYAKANPNMEILIVGPGNDTAHQENEYVEKSTFLAMADYYYTIAQNFFDNK